MMRQKHAAMRHAMCVKIALCKRAYCDMRLSQESWMISTFLRQHATVACRTNKPVYTARFCCTSHRVNAPLGLFHTNHRGAFHEIPPQNTLQTSTYSHKRNGARYSTSLELTKGD